MHLKDYPDALPADAAAAYVARSHILQLAAGVERTYFYAWDNGYMGLTEPGGKLWKPAAMAYAETVRWLAGATLESCSADKDDTWLCTIRRPNGRRGRIIWNPDRNLTVKLPGDWAARQTTSLAGRTALLEGKDEVAIGSSPLLIED
jgi:hypothetical protein